MSNNTPEHRGITLRSMRTAVEFVKYLTIRNGKLLRNGNRFTIECGAVSDVAGDPGVYKAAYWVPWRKMSESAEWEKIPASELVDEGLGNTGIIYDHFAGDEVKLWNQFEDGVDSYPWYGLRLTWDYLRLPSLELVED